MLARNNYRAIRLGIIAAFLLVRIIGVGADMSNSDALRWHRRTEAFLEALKRGNLRDTYQHYQPGVTLMWLGAVVEQALFSYQLTFTNQPLTLENTDWFPIIDGTSKIAIAAILGLLLYLQMALIVKVFNAKTALLYGFLMATEPYVMGLDRWFHLTSFETYFSFTAFLLILHWRKLRRFNILIFAGLLFSLAILSKLTALILLPFFAVLLLDCPISMPIKAVKPILLFVATTLFFFTLLFPAAWVAPTSVLAKLAVAANNAVVKDVRVAQLSPVVAPFYYLVVLGFKLSPTTLILGAFALGFVLLGLARRNSSMTQTRVVALYFIYFLVALTLPQKKIDRYALELVPPLLLLMAATLAKLRNLELFGAVLMSAIMSLVMVLRYFPTLSAYYSPIFGGSTEALKLGIYENNGEYFAEAARYLNTKGRKIYTYVPDNFESFSPYYKGRLQREFDMTTDYVVRSLDIDRKDPVILALPACSNLDASFGPAEFPVVFVYKCRPNALK